MKPFFDLSASTVLTPLTKDNWGDWSLKSTVDEDAGYSVKGLEIGYTTSVIPEPAAISLISIVSLGLLGARRIFRL